MIVDEIRKLIFEFIILNNISATKKDKNIGYIRKDKSISRFVIGAASLHNK